ncbi:GntR family transcriptional regulator [Thermogutta sp.]|jgi:GntR family transcriptional regulator|uniref:GntR family transcriptional regulator n=1 Tax=Thermogutta sp. TaxID=1962930 RepID=UPI00322082EE
MYVRVDPADATPIYEQIARQIKFAVASGALQPGELTPSVREMARRLAVNPNTVARAYRELQDEGILTVQRGLGLAVAEDAPQRCRKDREQWVYERLKQVVDEALRAQITPRQLERMLRDLLRSLPQQENAS